MVGCPTFTYPVLAPVSRCYPRLCGQVAYVLLTRSPLSRIAPLSIDLHVLGTPPAFILSQDQTLHLIDSLADSFVSLFFKLTFFSVLSCSVFKDLRHSSHLSWQVRILHLLWKLSINFFKMILNFFGTLNNADKCLSYIPLKEKMRKPLFSASALPHKTSGNT